MSGGYCKDCFTGTTSLGTPTGKVTTIHGLSVYVAEPEAGVQPKGLIVMLSDGFGWDFVNNRILADKYAKRGGFLVYLPDFMNGAQMDPYVLTIMDNIINPASWSYTIFVKPLVFVQAIYHAAPWLIQTRVSICKPRIFNFFSALRTSPPPFPTKALKIGAAGFCWGGYYAIQLCHDSPSSRVAPYSESSSSSNEKIPLVDCAFTAHPSNVTVPNDIVDVSIPLSIAVGNEDMAMKGPKILEMKEILEVKKNGDHVVNILPGAKHGFSNRTDPEDKLQMECAEKAEVQAIEWFTKWFS